MDEGATNVSLKSRVVQRITKVKGKVVAGATVAGGLALTACPVSAAEAAETGGINWTSLGDMMNGVTGIFPAMGNMVTGIVPILLTLAIVGFILYFFDAILDAIKGAMSFFKR